MSSDSAPEARPHIVAALIQDWHYEPFNEKCVSDPSVYPTHGWLCTRLEETEDGELYEVREWDFRPDCPPSEAIQEAA